MHQLFKIPEREFGPAPWWAWIGNLTPKKIDRQLKRFLAMRIYEIIIIPLYGLAPEYLGKRYFELYRHTCRRCRQWNIKLWIYDEFNWPSGTCAGRVLRDFPEARQQLIRFQWPGKPYSGTPEWNITPCDAFDLASYGAKWALETTGYLDTLNAKAVERFISMTMETYKKHLGEYFGNVIVGFFTDEPVLNRIRKTTFPYTPGIFEMFKKRYGYDLKPVITDLGMDSPRAFRVRRDYWTLVTELFQINFFRQYAQWCHKNGLKMTGHLLFEEHLAANLHSSGDIYADLSEMHVPGIDNLGGTTSFDHKPLRYSGEGISVDVTGKLIDSAAYFSGRLRTLCEAFGCSENSGTARFYKRALDFLLHHGISLINDNLFADSLTGFRKFCGCHSFWTPWVRHYGQFARHMQTLSYLNAGSKIVTTLAVYYPGLDAHVRCDIAGFARFQRSPFQVYQNPEWRQTQCFIARITHGLIRRQWNFYYIFDQVLRKAVMGHGGMRARSFECRAMILPSIHYLPPDVADKLSAFLANGGTIISIDRVPAVLMNDGSAQPWKRPANAKFIYLECTPDDCLLKLEKILREYQQRRVEADGAGADNIMLTHREKNGQEFILATNFGTSSVELKLKRMSGWIELDTLTRIPRHAPTSMSIMRPDETKLYIKPRHSLRLSGGTIALKDVTPLKTTWRLRLANGNTLSLPMHLYKGKNDHGRPNPFKDENWRPACPEVPPTPLEPGRQYWLKRVLVIDHTPKRLNLIVDGEDKCEVFLNGQPIRSYSDRRIIWDDANRTCDLRSAMCPGKNALMVRYTPSAVRKYVSRVLPLTDLPVFALAGDFCVKENEKNSPTAIMALAGHISTGCLQEQGLPGFVGVAEYSQDIDLDKVDPAAVLDLGHQTDMFEAVINGHNIGVAGWPPYILPAGKVLKHGNNRIVLRLFTAMGGVLSRHYNHIEKDKPPIGILDCPRLIGCRAKGAAK